MAKKLMALVLAVLMAVSLLPAAALADGETVIGSLSEINGSGSYVLRTSVAGDITLDNPITISGSVSIDLTGQTIKLSKDSTAEVKAVFILQEDASLTLKGTGTIDCSDVTDASGVLIEGDDATLNILENISITGKAFGVKTSSGADRAKVTVNTTGTITANVGMKLSDNDATLTLASGTISGDGQALDFNKEFSKMIPTGGQLFIDGVKATGEQMEKKPDENMKKLVFDDGKAPEIDVQSAVRTAESTGTVTFEASKSGTYYYQIGGDEPTTDALISGGKSAELAFGGNTLTLDELGSEAQTVYFAAKSGYGVVSDVVKSTEIPAALAAPESPVWEGKAAKWNEVAGAESYSVQLFKDGTASGTAIPATGTKTDDLSSLIAEDGSYTFQVQAVAEGTVGAWSAMSEAVVVDTKAPTLTDVAASRTAFESASVTFVSTEAGTLFYVVGGEEPSAETIFASELTADITVGENTVSIGNLTDASGVNVYLAAKDAAGNQSAVYTAAVAKYLAAPAVSGWKDGTKAEWNAVDGAESYTVQLFKDGTADENACGEPVSTTETSAELTVTESGTYYFKVQAVSGEVKSEWSAASEGLTVDKTAPDVNNAAGTRSDASSGKVTFNSDESGTVYYVVGGTPSKEDVLASDKKQDMVSGDNTIEISGLSDKSAVKVSFVAQDAAGNSTGVVTVDLPIYLDAPTTVSWVDNSSKALWDAVPGATGYNVQLIKDGADYGDPVPVTGTTVELSSYMNNDGVYTFKVQATADNAQSAWSAASSDTYTRDTVKPSIKNDPTKRISEKEAYVYFTSSEAGTYYYTVGKATDAAPAAEQIAVEANPHADCTSAKTTIDIKDIADKEARRFFVVVRDKSGNLSDTYTIAIPAYTDPTPTPTAAPTPTPTPTAAPKTYTVTLQGGTGYSIAATGGSSSPVTAGGSFSFTVTPSTGYTRGSNFSVKANGTALTARNGVYTISNIQANQTVSVSGIQKSSSGGGSTVVAPSITTTTIQSATLGKEYRQQITATGGTPITWSYTGTLPTGITLGTSTGILSGTPTQEGSFRVTIKATNSAGSSTRQLTLVVSGSEYTVTKGANAEWTQGTETGLDFTGSGKGNVSVKMDGATVSTDKYTVGTDGTVTLKPTYLDTLSSGSHTVTLVYSDGSAKAKFTIKAADKKIAPAITSQPVSSEIAEGESVTFTVTASGTTPLTCQWQVDKNDGKGWTDISGATNASYTVSAVTAEQTGWKYRCVVKNDAGSVESNAATLTVKEAIGDVTKDDAEAKGSGSSLLKTILIIVAAVAVVGLGVGLYLYFRNRNKYEDD